MSECTDLIHLDEVSSPMRCNERDSPRRGCGAGTDGLYARRATRIAITPTPGAEFSKQMSMMSPMDTTIESASSNSDAGDGKPKTNTWWCILFCSHAGLSYVDLVMVWNLDVSRGRDYLRVYGLKLRGSEEYLGFVGLRVVKRKISSCHEPSTFLVIVSLGLAIW